MSGSFDPYHKWLGISPKDQPPNHYRLLAIDFLESDPDVISSAADARMAHVRAFQTGKHSALSQEILNEIAAARICLLNAEKKAEYDRQLQEQARGVRQAPGGGVPVEAPPQPPGMPPPPPPAGGTSAAAVQVEGTGEPWTRRNKLPWQALVSILVAAVLFGALLMVFMKGGDSPETAENDPDGQTNVDPDPLPGPDPEPPAPNPQDPPDDDPKDPANPPETSQDPPDGPPDDPGGSDPTTNVAQAVGMNDDPPPDEREKPGPPDAATATAARERLQEILEGASAAALVEAAQAPDRPDEERFVLLEKAVDAAVASGDVATALAATEELVDRFEIDAFERKADTIDRLHASVATASAARTLAESGLALVDEALAEGKKDLAVRVAIPTVGAARKSDDNRLFQRAVRRYNEIKEAS